MEFSYNPFILYKVKKRKLHFKIWDLDTTKDKFLYVSDSYFYLVNDIRLKRETKHIYK